MGSPRSPHPRSVLRRAVLAAVSSAAVACAPAPAPQAPSSGPGTPPSAPVAGGGTASAGETPAPPVRLVLVSRTRIAQASPQALGLTGANKPNGWEQRLRQGTAGAPRWVPRSQSGLPLFIADSTPDGWLAFYRTPLAEQAGRSSNARFRAVMYQADDALRWDLDLNPFLSRPDHLEIQDIRYAGGKLYFNEACQSYSREAGGRCSSLVRVDPRAARVEWRSPPLTSNNIFLLHGPYAITGYGFTAEPDSLFVLSRETGRVLARAGLDSAHSYLEVKDGELWAVTASGNLYRFRMEEGRGS